MKKTRSFSSQRGSLLIVAMVLCGIIGISLVSYMQLSRSALTLSNRAVYNNAAINLAEQGIEEAMYGVNQLVANPAYTWPDWETHSAINKRRKWTGVTLSQNATAEYRVYFYNFSGTPAPLAVARALVTLGGGSSAPIEKWLEVRLAKTSKFANGLVAKTSIEFNGNNATVDSWHSEKALDGTPRPSPVPFSTAEKNDNGSVGSISVSSDAVLVKNADVWGYVSTGGVDPGTFVGVTGSILGEDSPVGSNVDPARTSTNFSANFDPVTAPTTAALSNLGSINADGTVLPLPADTVPNGTGDYVGYYIYDASKIDLNNKKISITGKVLLRLTASPAVEVGGGDGEIKIGASGSLVIYTPGDISIGGQGVSNGVDLDSPANGIQQDELGQPIKFQIWGTKTTGVQEIDIAGLGLFSGVIYAPQGDVSIVGNGAVCGSVVANTIDLSGNAKFHYDESLADFGGGNPFRIARWRELTTAADRATYSAVLTW